MVFYQDKKRSPMVANVLAVRGISKHFGALIANDSITLDLKEGEIHAIIGPNGAGKSTLIAQICGTLKPDSGSVAFLGKDVTNQNTRQRAQQGLARTFQISALAMEDTVLQNAILGVLGASGGVLGKSGHFFNPVLKDKELRMKAEAALGRVGLKEHLSVRTNQLSHGQRRQLEVAMALTLNPKAFVMDEPMAGAGVSGSKNLTALLDGLRHEAPILLVEHDMDVVFALADRISVLVYGKLVATGRAQEIKSNALVQEAYLGSQE